MFGNLEGDPKKPLLYEANKRWNQTYYGFLIENWTCCRLIFTNSIDRIDNIDIVGLLYNFKNSQMSD